MKVTKILSFAIVILLISGVFARAGEIKIAVIDVNRVLNECEEGKDAKNKMKARYEELQDKLEKEQGELKKMKEEIDKNKIVLGEEKIKEKEKEFQKRMAEFRKLVAESEKEMRDRESAYTKVILEKIKRVVKDYVKEKNLNMVLDVSGGIVYADDELNITDDIIEILNKEYKGGENKGK